MGRPITLKEKTLMALFDNLDLPDNANMRAVKGYLQAQADKDFSAAAEFFSEDVDFVGLILKAAGRDVVAGEMSKFINMAIDHIRIEAIAPVSEDRVMALYWFKLKPAAEPQILCDHITLKDGKISRIENIFDVSKLPPMPAM